VVNVILPTMGINRTAARAVVFSTSQYGGLDLDHLTPVITIDSYDTESTVSDAMTPWDRCYA
jgi:hypothetical protein